jgi:hypothetical protein
MPLTTACTLTLAVRGVVVVLAVAATFALL